MKRFFLILPALFCISTALLARNNVKDIDWRGSTATQQVLHKRYGDYQSIISQLVEAYPQHCTLFSIGRSVQERDLLCLKITSPKGDAASKIGIGVFGNIHGGEMESAEAAMYTGWWLLVNSEKKEVKDILDKYVIYCVPMINPDGMEESFTYNVRANLSLRDADGDGIPFSDPYTDINGDGFIANVYMGPSGMTVDGGTLKYLGMESPDWNLDGKMGNDPRNSGVDMNRTFDYMFSAYDVTTYNPRRISYKGYEQGSRFGSNNYGSNGNRNGAAAEPEIAAVQNFLNRTPMNALVTFHTGIQSVLWPWCYKEADYENDADLVKMAEVGRKMAKAASKAASTDGTERNFYYRSSWSDYPTTAEMIDYAYGRLGIHAYTIEIYKGGSSSSKELNYDGTYSPGCSWQNGEQLAGITDSFVEYTYNQVLGSGDDCLGFSKAQVDALGLNEGMSLYFKTTSRAKMSGVCPVNMNLMMEAAKDAVMEMIVAEPYGSGWNCPYYLEAVKF